MTTTANQAETEWWSIDGAAVADQLDTSVEQGLGGGEVAARLDAFGPNSLPAEAPPSTWRVAMGQLRDPMNVMLAIVAVASIAIGQISTGILVGVLVLLNVVMGARQELKARASVAALEDLQVPFARVVREGTVVEIPAVDLVPGDVGLVEAGDLVPADGRIVVSASLEVQEAALTGESAPIAKDASSRPPGPLSLGDRTNLVFQNTSVTRGTATFIVTATGSTTEMGKIADMLQAVDRPRSPLQRELDSLTTWLGILAWAAVAIIFVVGVIRGLDTDELILLGVATAISAIPTGLPTFVQAMLSSGSRRLAEAKAVVKSLTDVETLGATSAINSDKTGTLTLNQMTATAMFTGGEWYHVEGAGYAKVGSIRHAAGQPVQDFTNLGLGLVLASDATVADDGTVIGDPTEAALVVLAAKVGIDAPLTRREFPRIAEVPFDSAYKFMATFHAPRHLDDVEMIELVKGAPDVLIDRSTSAYWGGDVVPIDQVKGDIEAANRSLGERGLRVLSFAVRRMRDDDREAVVADPMAHVGELTFVSLVGIIDPLRPEAKTAVATAHTAGIDVRMITGDHAITAKAIGDDLELGPGVITGAEFQALTDDEVLRRLPELHVLGRVTPQDKLRLVTLMQQAGEIVAMTGDAVNDAAALKKADIGVAMGSGAEVSKQAAKMVLTDDNFATLVHAVQLGRDIYGKITAYIRYQLSGLFGVLILMIMATVLNINSGIALTPAMLLFINFLIAVFPVVAIITDVTDPNVMTRRPRDPAMPIFNKRTGPRWLATGAILAAAALVPLLWGPDELQVGVASVSQSMAFAVAALGTIGIGLTARRDLAPAWEPPLFPYTGWLSIGAVLTWLAVELPLLQRWIDTTGLTGSQWLGVVALALLTPVFMEASKLVRRSAARA